MPQNCETNYREIENSYSMESRDLNSSNLTVPSDPTMTNNNGDNLVNNQIESPSSVNLTNDTINDNCNLIYDSPKCTHRDYLNEPGKIGLHSQQHQLNHQHHHTIIETTRSINHLIPSKKAKLIGGDSSGIISYPDSSNINNKIIEDKPTEYMLIDSTRKIVNHHHAHHHPMAPVDVNRVSKLTNSKSQSQGTINSSIYLFTNDGKLTNSLDDNSESLYHSSVNLSLIKPYPSSIHINSSASSGQENHLPSPKSSTIEAINSLKPTMTNLSLMTPHGKPTNYRNGYNIKPSVSPSLINRSRSDNAISISTEIQPITINKPTCESIPHLGVGGNSHIQGTINRSSFMSSSVSSSSSSSSSSIDRILPMINVVSLTNETTTTSPTATTTTSSYNKETISTISDHDETIMNISDFVNDYSTSHLYSNNTSDSQEPISSVVHHPSPVDLRRVRYRETWDFLNKSDLIEVTLKTADLMKRNQLLQRDIERLKEEVAKIIPSSRIFEDNNQMRVNNVCIENSA